MRASLVAALLANCGLFVPAAQARVPRYDNFFLRTTSDDVPSEGKSAFGAEMDDMRVLMRDSTERSLLMIDELGILFLNKEARTDDDVKSLKVVLLACSHV